MKPPPNSIPFLMTLMIVTSLLFGTLVFTVANNWEMFQGIKYKYRAQQEPEHYSKCLLCGEIKPHKIMSDLGEYLWHCEGCGAKFLSVDELREELRRRNHEIELLDNAGSGDTVILPSE